VEKKAKDFVVAHDGDRRVKGRRKERQSEAHGEERLRWKGKRQVTKQGGGGWGEKRGKEITKKGLNFP